MQTAKQLSIKLQKLHAKRKAEKKRRPRTGRLTPLQRDALWLKTDGHCHICGCRLKPDHFQADHVKNHIGGGGSAIENFLPACPTCNNYRWHYLPEEIQWILNFGVFAKTQIENETGLGIVFADAFLKKENRIEAARKKE